MDDQVDEIIRKPRLKIGAETDADLARKFRLGKSTISSWRARGKVPKRFHDILSGASHQAYLAPPGSWSRHETAAFYLALFRFTRVFELPMRDDAGLVRLDQFMLQEKAFWALFNDAQLDIASMIDEWDYPPSDAGQRLVYEGLHDPGSVQRDRQRLLDMSSLFKRLFA